MKTTRHEWDKIISWFEVVKRKTETHIPDNFEIAGDKVIIVGETLSDFMLNFAEDGDIYQAEQLHTYDIADTSNRTQLKSHLINSLYSLKRH